MAKTVCLIAILIEIMSAFLGYGLTESLIRLLPITEQSCGLMERICVLMKCMIIL